MRSSSDPEQEPAQVYHAQFSPTMNTSGLIEAIAAGMESVGWTKLISPEYWQTAQIDIVTSGVPEDSLPPVTPKAPTATTPQLKFQGPVPGGYFASTDAPDTPLMEANWPHVDGLTPVAFPPVGESFEGAEGMIAMVFPGWEMHRLPDLPGGRVYRMSKTLLGTGDNDLAFSGGQWFTALTPFTYGGGYRLRSVKANRKIDPDTGEDIAGTEYDIVLRTNELRGLTIEFISTYGAERKASFGMDIGNNFTYQTDVKWTSTSTWVTYDPAVAATYLVNPVTAIANPYQLLIFDADTADRDYSPNGQGGNSFLASAPYITEYEPDRNPIAINYCAFALAPGLMKDALTFSNSVTVTAAFNGGLHSYRVVPYERQSSGHPFPFVENFRPMSSNNGLPPEWNSWVLLSPYEDAEAAICGQLWDSYLVPQRFNYRAQVARPRDDIETDLFTCVSSSIGSMFGGNQGALFVRHANIRK